MLPSPTLKFKETKCPNMIGFKETEVLVYNAALGHTGNVLDNWDTDGAPGHGVCIHKLILVTYCKVLFIEA